VHHGKNEEAREHKWESGTSLSFFVKHDRQIKVKMPPDIVSLGASAGLHAAHNQQLLKLFQVVFRQDGQTGTR
jgi:hypothetical protein